MRALSCRCSTKLKSSAVQVAPHPRYSIRLVLVMCSSARQQGTYMWPFPNNPVKTLVTPLILLALAIDIVWSILFLLTVFWTVVVASVIAAVVTLALIYRWRPELYPMPLPEFEKTCDWDQKKVEWERDRVLTLAKG